MAADTGSARHSVYLMANHYPCMPTAGLKLSHEIARRDSWEPGREAACSMALSREEYDAAVAKTRETGEAEPFRENYEVCICRDPLPLLPPRCPLDAPTCGNYPNDPTKMPAVAARLTDDQLLRFCSAAKDNESSNIYDERLARLICRDVLGPALDAVPPPPAKD